MHESSDLRTGLRAGLPLVLPTFAIGLSFGVLAQPVMGSVAPVVMSIAVFSGAAQFAALTVLTAGGGGGGGGGRGGRGGPPRAPAGGARGGGARPRRRDRRRNAVQHALAADGVRGRAVPRALEARAGRAGAGDRRRLVRARQPR